MKKYIIISISILVILLVGLSSYFVYLYVTNKPEKDSQSGRGKITTEKKINLKLNNSSVQVNDFINYPVRHEGNVYYIADNLDYNITYWADEKKFYIPISTAPVIQTGQLAERKFLELLGISKDDACKLPVVITGAYSVDEQFANNAEYSLSFCPGKHLE